MCTHRYMYKEGMKLAARYAAEEAALKEELKVRKLCTQQMCTKEMLHTEMCTKKMLHTVY